MRARWIAGGVLFAVLVALTVAVDAVDRPWYILEGPHVIVVGQQSPKTLRGIAVDLEQFRFVVGAFLRGGHQPLSMPTTVYAFDDRKALEPFVPLYQGKPASLGGYCHCGSASDVNFIALDLGSYADASVLIFHEYAHQLVRHAVGGMPVWLNEGLAEYFSTFRLAGDGRQAMIGKPVARHVTMLRERFLPLSQIVAVDHSSALYNESDRRTVFYAESWALTHYLMIKRPNGVAAINRYIGAPRAGRSEDEVFTGAFGVAPRDMEGELRDYIQHPAFPWTNYTLKNRVEVGEPEAAATLPAAEIEARLGDVQRRVGRTDEATARIERAAASGPEVARAQLTLALLRLQQDRAAEAWPLLRKAAALASNDFFTQYTFGLSLLRADPGGSAGEDRVELAHGALSKAVAASPESAEALAWLAYADLVAGTRLAEGQSALTKAIELSPGRIDYRLRLAEIYLRQDNFAASRSLLSSIAAAKGDEDAARHARALLERLDAGERSAARRPEPATAAGRSVDAPAPAGPTGGTERDELDGQVRFQLRKVRAGEERAYGELIELVCAPVAVQFHLRVGTRVVVAVAREMKDVELTTFVSGRELTLACGRRSPPDTVLLTWRMKPPTTVAGNTVVGEAVAVEFVPRGYLP